MKTWFAFAVAASFAASTALAATCDEILPCSTNYVPVCGSDGKTYGNACELEQAKCKNTTLVLVAQGACASCKDMVCPTIDNPVCGSDGKTYGNKCELEIAKCTTGNPSLTVSKEGACADCQTACSDVYAPVCGSDGVTYTNQCELNVAKCLRPETALVVVHTGPCTVSGGGPNATHPGCK